MPYSAEGYGGLSRSYSPILAMADAERTAFLGDIQRLIAIDWPGRCGSIMR